MKIRFSLVFALSGSLLLFLLLNQPICSDAIQPKATVPSSTYYSSNSDLPIVEFVSSFGGVINAIAISDTTVYVGEGASLVVLDVSNPLQPSRRSQLPLPDLVGNIQVVGNIVYVANRYSGLQIVDVADPANPTLLGNYDTPGVAIEVLVANERAYIADGDSGVQIVDVSDVTTPQWIGAYKINGSAYTVQLVNDVLYLGDPNQGLFILDVGDPATPVLVNHLPQMIILDIQVSGGFVYLAGQGLRIFEMSNPISPTLVCDYYHGVESATGVQVNEGLAYVITYGTLTVIDVSEPSSPIELDSVTVSSPTDLAIDKNFVYVAEYKGNVRIIDVSESTAILPSGQYSTLGGASAIQVVGNIAYLSDHQGLHIVDIADPAHPIHVTRAEDSRGASDLAVKEEFVYLGTNTQGMQIFDVSTPLSPTFVGSYPRNVTEIELRDDLAYIVGNGSLEILDISDPLSPTLLGSHLGVHDLDVVGTRVYGLDQTGFVIVDVSDPAVPELLGRYTLPISFTKPTGIAALGNFVYLTVDFDGGLYIVDVSDPNSPMLKGMYTTYTGAIQIAGDYAFSTSGTGLRNIHIFDVSNPAILKPRSVYTLPSQFEDLHLTDDLLFIADGSGGLQILRIHPDRFPPDIFLPLVLKNSG
ncbi:MAG: LVIVD repeat-containing protein [Anaerolineae bacterium]